MWKRTALLVALMGVALSGEAGAQNIVLISFDDAGVDKIGAYGYPDPAPTPNIDALASMGVMFTNAWANRICSPSRAATLTGLRPSESGVGANIRFDSTNSATARGLDPALPNIANVLQTNGYRTAAIGKWHLAGRGTVEEVVAHPNQAGFDHYAGTIVGPRVSVTGLPVTGYFQWEKCINGSCALSTNYLSTETTDEALGQLSGSEPFFLYVAYNAPHNPHHDPPAHLHSYPGQCEPSPAPLTPVCHKAMTEAADTELGRLLAAVDWTDTTVIFIGDNGSPGATVEAPFSSDQAKGSLYEGGILVPFIVTGEAVGESARGEAADKLVGVTDIFATVMEISAVPTAAASSISFAPLLLDPSAAAIRDVLYTETFLPNGGPPRPETHLRAAREARYKLIHKATEPAELYDLLADPFEQNPLDISNASSAARRAFKTLAPIVGVTTVPEPARALLQIAAVLTVLLTKRSARRGATDPK